MSMSRKDYVAIAAIFKTEIEANEDSRQPAYNLALQIADYFGKENERFDEDRFLKACGF